MYDRRESFPAGTPANDSFANRPDRRTGRQEHDRLDGAPAHQRRPLEPDTRAEAYLGKPVKDMDGTRIGVAERVLYREPGDAEWLAVSGMTVRGTLHAAPLEGATIDETDEELVLAYPKDMVEASPDLEDGRITPDIERALYAHYNMRRMAQDSDREPSGLDDPLHPNRP